MSSAEEASSARLTSVIKRLANARTRQDREAVVDELHSKLEEAEDKLVADAEGARTQPTDRQTPDQPPSLLNVPRAIKSMAMGQAFASRSRHCDIVGDMKYCASLRLLFFLNQEEKACD